ncbi:hypothetical protein Tco_0273266 [Tanacetum coccineum]
MKLNLELSFDEFDDEDYMVSCFDDLDFFKDLENEFPVTVHNDVLMSKSDFFTKPTLKPQHIDEFDLKDETLLSEYDEVEQNVLYFNDLFPFSIIYPYDLCTDNSKNHKNNGLKTEQLRTQNGESTKAAGKAIKVLKYTLAATNVIFKLLLAKTQEGMSRWIEESTRNEAIYTHLTLRRSTKVSQSRIATLAIRLRLSACALDVLCPNNSNVTIPRRRRRQVSNIVEPEIRTIVAPMAERTMEELLHAPTERYGEAIVLPEINADHFEIKTNLLQLVQANPF